MSIHRVFWLCQRHFRTGLRQEQICHRRQFNSQDCSDSTIHSDSLVGEYHIKKAQVKTNKQGRSNT